MRSVQPAVRSEAEIAQLEQRVEGLGLLLLLLSRDLQPECRDLRFADRSPKSTAFPMQPPLPGFEAFVRHLEPTKNSIARRQGIAHFSADPFWATYMRRLVAHGAAKKGAKAYEYQLRCLARVAERLTGQKLCLADLFRNPALLGLSLTCDQGEAPNQRLSRWTLAQRRSAARSFATMMHPELIEICGEDPHEVLDRALRGVAERVGGGYRLTGGRPRRRGRPAPTATETAEVVRWASRAQG